MKSNRKMMGDKEKRRKLMKRSNLVKSVSSSGK